VSCPTVRIQDPDYLDKSPALPSPEDRERLDPYEPWEHLGCDRATYLATNDYPRR